MTEKALDSDYENLSKKERFTLGMGEPYIVHAWIPDDEEVGSLRLLKEKYKYKIIKDDGVYRLSTPEDNPSGFGNFSSEDEAFEAGMRLQKLEMIEKEIKSYSSEQRVDMWELIVDRFMVIREIELEKINLGKAEATTVEEAIIERQNRALKKNKFNFGRAITDTDRKKYESREQAIARADEEDKKYRKERSERAEAEGLDDSCPYCDLGEGCNDNMSQMNIRDELVEEMKRKEKDIKDVQEKNEIYRAKKELENEELEDEEWKHDCPYCQPGEECNLSC